jgi:hypothetical protein
MERPWMQIIKIILVCTIVAVLGGCAVMQIEPRKTGGETFRNSQDRIKGK